MKIYLCARDKEQINSWRLFCGKFDFVVPTLQPILDIPAEGLVAAGNSFGNMSGGLDLLYINYFGKQMEDDVQNRILKEYDGELLVGQAVDVDINHPSYTYNKLIYAPTMRVPEVVKHTINVYLSTRAAIKLAKKLELNSITIPSMGTGTGCVAPNSCAKQMAAAIDEVFVSPPEGIRDVYIEQDRMVKHIVPSSWLKIQYIMEDN